MRIDSRGASVYLVRMTSLSPLDALGPAFRRTREVLAAPFRLGFFLKIALVAALTQPSFYSATISYPIRGGQLAFLMGHFAGSSGNTNDLLAGSGIAAIGVSSLVVMAIFGVALWVLSRISIAGCASRCLILWSTSAGVSGRRGRVWTPELALLRVVFLVSSSFLAVAAPYWRRAVSVIREVRPLAARSVPV